MKKEKDNGPFAMVQTLIINEIIQELMIDSNAPHYDNKALTLFLLLRFRAGSDLRLYTSLRAICNLLGISNRTENKKDIENNLLQMQNYGLITIQNDLKDYFWITLQYPIFFPDKDYVVIYLSEFQKIFEMKQRDKLFLIYCCIKKYQNKNSKISFVSAETIMADTHLSKPTVLKSIDILNGALMDVYKAHIRFKDKTSKEINYYKPLIDGTIASEDVAAIVNKHFKNVERIKRR